MSHETFLGLFIVSGFATLMGSVPILFHRQLKEEKRCFWESFGGGVMMSASIFSLFLPAWRLSSSLSPLVLGATGGFFFIVMSAMMAKKITQNLARRRAFLFVFVMGLHNIPEGLSVGVDVAALGWVEALPLCVAIFIQNIPEGFVSSLSFLLGGFSLPAAILANAVTALIETVSALSGHVFANKAIVSLPLLLAFAGASMMSVVGMELIEKKRHGEKISRNGFIIGLILCAVLDLFL